MVDVNPILQMVGPLSLGKMKWLHEVDLKCESRLRDYKVIVLSTPQMFLLSCPTHLTPIQSQANVSGLFLLLWFSLAKWYYSKDAYNNPSVCLFHLII